MRIHLSVEAETTEELLAAIKELTAGGVTVHTQTKPEKNPRNKPAAPAKAPEPAADTADPKGDDTASGEAEEIPTVEELKKAAVEKGKTLEGKVAIKKLLASFESPSISAIPEDKRAAFLTALEGL